MTPAATKKADAAHAAAYSWAQETPLDQLRRGNAERVARSYGISVQQATSIIVDAFRKRSK